MNVYKVRLRYCPGAKDVSDRLIAYTDSTRMSASSYVEAAVKVSKLPKYSGAVSCVILDIELVEKGD